MIVQLGFYRRRADLTTEEFRRLWSEVYGPMYRNHPELSRHILRYVQHRLSPAGVQSEAQMLFDGFSETWFESPEASEALQREPIFINEIAPLAGTFIDLENSRFMAYDSQVYQIGGPPPTTALV